jgi:hypothetical protein
MFGWYLFFSLMLSSVGRPFSLPVGDLSGMFRRFEETAEAGEGVV